MATMSVPSRAAQIENELLARRLPGGLLPDDAGFVLPDYRGRSLANIPATLAALLGVPLAGAPPLHPEYTAALGSGIRRVIFLLVDAFGYAAWQETIAADPEGLWARLAGRGRLLPLTSIYPSTTAAALTTLMTGTEPVTHGMLGYQLWLREFGVLAQMLALKPALAENGKDTLMDWGLEPEKLLPMPGVGQQLADAGVHTLAWVPGQFRTGALTRMCYRGFGSVRGYDGLPDLFHQVRQTMARDRHERSFYYLYWGGVDTAIHAHGSAGGHWQEQVARLREAFQEQFWARMTPKAATETALIITADHGFVDSPAEDAHDCDADPVLRRELLIPFSGESRAAYLHTLAGDDERTLGTIQTALGTSISSGARVTWWRRGCSAWVPSVMRRWPASGTWAYCPSVATISIAGAPLRFARPPWRAEPRGDAHPLGGPAPGRLTDRQWGCRCRP
jgi:hypothetical protein